MTDEEAREHNSAGEIEADVRRLEILKKEKKALEAEITDIEAYLDKTLDRDFKFDDKETGDRVQATIVRGTMDRFDEHLISTKYPQIWDRVTRRVLDKGYYLDLVKSGVITPELNAQFHHEVPKKSYVKITRYFKGNAIEASE